MNRSYRLSRSSDIRRVRRTGKSYAHPLAVLIASPAQNANPRFGFVTGRTVGSAVRRNRAKRLLRSALRHYLPSVSPGWDAIMIARPPLLQAQWSEILAAVGFLLRRSGMIQEL